jgi:pyridoxamine 5'-phosphate oxidase
MENPFAALVVLWAELERQVRIEGQVERCSPAESDAYFHSRPLGSQLGAWASRQSEVISSRADLDQRLQALMAEHANGEEVPRPPYWGGHRLHPTSLEFWQGRPNRLHDRLRYRLLPDGRWLLERLSP